MRTRTGRLLARHTVAAAAVAATLALPSLAAPGGAAAVTVSASCKAQEGGGSYVGDPTFEQLGPTIAAQLQGFNIPLVLPGDITAETTVEPGGTVTYNASLTFDPQALAGAARTLALPQVASQLSIDPNVLDPGFGIQFTLDNMKLTIPAPAGTTLSSPTVGISGTNAPTIAGSIDGTGALELAFGQVKAGAYGAQVPAGDQVPPIGPLTVTFSVQAAVATDAASPVELKAGPASVDITLLFILGNGQDPTVTFGWGNNPADCTPDGAVLASTVIGAAAASTTTAPGTGAVTAQPSFTG